MSAPSTLALFASPRVATDAVEFLRVVAAIAAVGSPITLAEIGLGRGVLGSDSLPADAERYLDALRELAITPTPLQGPPLLAALLHCDALLLFGSPDRPRDPAILEVSDSWLRSAAPHEDSLLRCGQAIRIRL